MGFRIRFLADDNISLGQELSKCNGNRQVALGVITIGDFNERFEALLGFWGKDDYQAHWQDALGRILRREEISCLITSMADPKTANFITWWPLYREGSAVIVQNHIFFLKDAKGKFDSKNPYTFVQRYRSVNADGQPISQWITSVEDIQEFVREISGTGGVSEK
jgi:hypothetical protein